jgi:hypothetical protein
MCRIACLRIPKFQIAVHQKIEPELKGKPLVLLANSKNQNLNQNQSLQFSSSIGRAKVLVCSREAERANIYPGMTFTEARAICSHIVWREYDDKFYKSAQKKLARELIAASPRVSTRESGLFYIDAEGFNRLGGENKLCRDVLKLASRYGFVDGRIGLADSAFAARVASRSKTKRWYIVTPDCDTVFLSPLSIDFLPVEEEAKGNLKELGIRTIGQFTEVPLSSYIGRFDSSVLNAYELACGKDNTQPALPVHEKQYNCTIDIGSATESLRDTLFIFKTMLERLTRDLQADGLCADELTVWFFNDNDRFDERTIKLIRSSSNSKFLLDVLRLSLESKQLIREFTAVYLSVSRFSKEYFEQTRATISQPENSGCSREELLLTGGDELDDSSEPVLLLLQRFITRLGEEALVKPVLNDQYLPELAGVWIPVVSQSNFTSSANSSTPVHEVFLAHSALKTTKPKSRKDCLMPGLVLKRHLPAMPVFVQFKETSASTEVDKYTPFRPAAITYRGHWYHVNQITTPEKISGMWWEKPVRKSYYVALIEKKPELAMLSRAGVKSGLRSILPALMTVLLVYDHQERGWFVEGVFD